MNASIPILDARELVSDDPAALASFGAQFRRAFTHTGFAYLTNHGIPDALVAQVLDENRRFHCLSSDQKQSVALDANHRGYIGFGTSTDRASTLAEVTEPNMSESFMVMREDAPTSPAVLAGEYLAGPNQWPNAMPGFRTSLERYASAMSALANKILHACATELGDTTDELRHDFNPATTWLRLLRYPGTPGAASKPPMGSAPHHDFGAITLLAQDDVGGLEVMSPSGQWIEVEPRAGDFILNVGEMLHRYSGGLLRATPHRVVNRSERERFSVAFFYDPNMNATVAPLAQCRTHGTHLVEDAIRFDDFVRNALTRSYTKHAT